MTLSIIIISLLSAFILYKVRNISLRNNLDTKNEKRLLISSALIILFLITNIALPYPESLYWFLSLSVVMICSILSFDVLKSEFKRFKTLDLKNKVLNIFFYGLLIAVTNLYI